MSEKPFGKKPPAAILADEWSTEPGKALDDMLAALKAARKHVHKRWCDEGVMAWLLDLQQVEAAIEAAERLKEDDAWPPVL